MIQKKKKDGISLNTNENNNYLQTLMRLITNLFGTQQQIKFFMLIYIIKKSINKHECFIHNKMAWFSHGVKFFFYTYI